MDHDLKALIATLNPSCRQSLEEAASLAVGRGHANIEVEHLLLALLARPRADLSLALAHFGVRAELLERELEARLEALPGGHTRMPNFAPLVPQLLREAWLVSSLQLESSRVRSGAILLAARTVEGVRDVLVGRLPSLRAVDPELLRVDMRAILKGSVEAASSAAPMGDQPPSHEAASLGVGASSPALSRYTLDLTARAREGALDPVVGRGAEIRQLMDVLSRRRQNNPLLAGEAGVGKTAIVEGLALRIARGDVPPSLRGVAIRALDLALLQAGAGVQGEFERRLKAVIGEVKAALQPVILFIDEAHMLIGAGGAAGTQDAANLLKPALARGELRTIAATTWGEYKRTFERDPALARRFQVVAVHEPDTEGAEAMLRATVGKLEEHHGVRVREAAVRDAVRLSQRYLTGRRLPDKAVSVLDTACARVAIGLRSTPAVVEDAGRRLDRLELERGRLEADTEGAARRSALDAQIVEARDLYESIRARWHDERALVGALRSAEAALERARRPSLRTQAAQAVEAARAALGEAQGEIPMIPLEVGAGVVAEVVADWTGVPAGKMLANDVEALLDLADRLEARVLGQRPALEGIARRIRTSRAGLERPDKPAGVFLLVGPSGVGKTETALALAEVLFGDPDRLVTVNMSEYQEAHSVANLKGAPAGYVGYGRGGVLTEAVRRRPYSVVLLDEVDKAHRDVRELFLQVFDKGRLDDAEGLSVDFRHAVILLTANVGAEVVEDRRDSDDAAIEAALRPVLGRHFGEAWLGRVRVVPFRPLAGEDLRRIAALKLGRVAARFTERYGASLVVGPRALSDLVRRCAGHRSGARALEQLIADELLPALSSAALEQVARGARVGDMRVEMGATGLVVSMSGGSAEASAEEVDPGLASEDPESGAAKRLVRGLISVFGATSRSDP